MSAARDLLPLVNETMHEVLRPFAVPDGAICKVVRMHLCYDQEATSFLDPLGLGDIHVFTDGSSLHYDYGTQQWCSKRGTITSFGGARTLRRTKGSWHKEPTP